MSFTYKIAKYKLFYSGQRKKVSWAITQINLYNSTNKILGNVEFYRYGQILRKNYLKDLTPKEIVLRMYESQLVSVVDMLRKEKPCSVICLRPILQNTFWKMIL